MSKLRQPFLTKRAAESPLHYTYVPTIIPGMNQGLETRSFSCHKIALILEGSIFPVEGVSPYKSYK